MCIMNADFRPFWCIVVVLVTGIRADTVKDRVVAFLEEYNVQAAAVAYEAVEAEWAYVTNITEENRLRSVNVSLRQSQFTQEVAKKAKSFNVTSLPTEMQRQISVMAIQGTDAMKNETKLSRVTFNSLFLNY
ncbi:ACE2-like protein [Mya arenaria]|uniref:ACE2-like protein n=1 Tax=Mya arenaria TaxID=6604 RepID=A0ABY7E8K6_MYAAR|nr:ACE2-like protein [Mya arenaria]